MWRFLGICDGAVYTVQYTTDLAEPANWQGAAIVQLPSSPYLWIDTRAPAAGRRYYRAVEGPTNMVWIPPGMFTMGSPETEADRQPVEGPRTVVTLTRGFFIGKHEVTQGEYLAVTGSNPSSLNVVRGGNWFYGANFCRSAKRDGLTRDTRGDNIGFRVVLSPGQP